jgi:hypothetical protein
LGEDVVSDIGKRDEMCEVSAVGVSVHNNFEKKKKKKKKRPGIRHWQES